MHAATWTPSDILLREGVKVRKRATENEERIDESLECQKELMEEKIAMLANIGDD